MASYDVLVRNPDGTKGGPIKNYREMKCLLRWNDVGSIALSLDAENPAVPLLDAPGAGVIVRRAWRNPFTGRLGPMEYLISGYVDHPESSADTRTEGSGPPAEPEPGAYSLLAYDDLVALRDRWTWPVPTAAWDAQPDAYHVLTGSTEGVIRGFVAAHTGTEAGRPERRTILRQTPNQARGRDVRRRTRFENLLTLCQLLAEPAGLGFRALQAGDAPYFDVYQPQDRSAEVKFTVGRNNLVSRRYHRACSTGNWIGLGAGGEGTARILRSTSDPASINRWGRRVEAFVDRRDTTDETELADALAEALAEHADTEELELSVQDTDQVAFGRDYGLGDIVTAIFDRYSVTAVVRQVEISVDGKGLETITPTLGGSGAGGDPDRLDTRKIRTRLGRLEAP